MEGRWAKTGESRVGEVEASPAAVGDIPDDVSITPT